MQADIATEGKWTGALLGWAAEHGRRPADLPWRATRDPWAILVSEVMLQQTQVVRVVPAWRTFLDRFPDPVACAGSPPGAVIAAWAGLGYNRRALNLHRASCAVRDRHGGVVPDRLDSLLSLPGVGPYTARAVLAFAFERDVAVLDVNAERVLARAVLAGTRTAGASRPDRPGSSPAERQRLADGLVPEGQGWAWNQAVLDLGAGVCVATDPDCPRCPLREDCAWRRGGGPDPAMRGSRQSTFEGSDRQGRGRLVAALRAGPLSRTAVAEAMGWPEDPERVERVLVGLRRDGLVVEHPDETVGLPV